MEREWLFQRCREIQKNPDGYLDLWFREGYKSTIITFGLTIMEILMSHGEDPLIENELTFGIFSHNRPIAKGFLRQIKREFEINDRLKEWFPDVLYANPEKESPKWSEDDGLLVKRKSNPKESTVEAWGLVDSQPTSKHFMRLIYDDVVTLESVRSPDMMQKTTESLEISFNLGADGGTKRFAGTRYHYNDTYKILMDRGTAKPRIYPGTHNGEVDGEPVLWTKEKIREKRKEMGPYTFSTQILLNPKGDDLHTFKREWLQYFSNLSGEGMNVYILVDPANEKKKRSDYTSVMVVGLAADKNMYILDMYRDRLSLVERCDLMFRLHQRWQPKAIGYEQYGMQADIQHFEDKMNQDNYRFPLTEVGGNIPKRERIGRLIPLFSAKRVYLPEVMIKTNYEQTPIELTNAFVEQEIIAFPVGVHDDMLDALARIFDVGMVWPKIEQEVKRKRYALDSHNAQTAWSN